jgi:hypothetical protein
MVDRGDAAVFKASHVAGIKKNATELASVAFLFVRCLVVAASGCAALPPSGRVITLVLRAQTSLSQHLRLIG